MEENSVEQLEFEKRKHELKSQALRERVAEQEDRISDLRVELTITVERMEQYIGEVTDKLHEYEQKVIECENNHGSPDGEGE